MLMMLMKFILVRKIFSEFFFQDQDQDSTMKINNEIYVLCTKDTHQIWCRFAKFL